MLALARPVGVATVPGEREPSDPTKEALVRAIHASARKGAFALAGGGSRLLADLLTAPGASATVLEALVPYAEPALGDFLGGAPEQACSASTAGAMALRCLLRARALGGDFGFAITASLATNRAKRGAHRAHVAFHDARLARAWRCPLDAGDRPGEEDAVADLALRALAFSLGVGQRPAVASEEAEAGAMAPVVLGERSHASPRAFKAVLPGAFDPLHDGHRAMREDAARRLGCAVGFELCVANVDKPPLDYLTLARRLRQFDRNDVAVTCAPTFLAKARALGAVTFVVGADTIRRIADARYYGGAAARDAALGELAALGCAFLVYGRADAAGAFATLADCALPEPLAAMCEGVPEAEFRRDVSSTALRLGSAGGSTA